MGFLRQVYWNGLPFLSPDDLSNPGIKLTSSLFPAWQMDSLPLSQLGRPKQKDTNYIEKLYENIRNSYKGKHEYVEHRGGIDQ